MNLASEGGEKLTCIDLLTNLAYKAATQHTVSAARVLAGLPGPGAPRIVFTDMTTSNGASTTVSTNTTPEVQISTGQRSSVWGNSAEAYEMNKNGSMRRLQCDPPAGSRYSCYLPGKADDAAFNRANFRIVDLNHKVDKTGTIGTLEAWAALEDCDDAKSTKCRVPSFWDFGIDPADTSWTLTFDFVNVPSGITLTGTLSGFTVQSHASVTSDVTPLTVQLTVKDLMQRKLTDHMPLKVSCSPGPCPNFPDQSVAISNLYSHSVPVADAGVDWTNWTRTNLLHSYTKLQIGKNPAHNISCNGLSRCTLSDGDLDKDSSGQISLLDDSGERIPLLQLVNGKLVNAAYTKPKDGAGGAGGGKSTAGPIIIVNGSTSATATIDSLLPSLGAQQQITTEAPK